MRMFLAALLLAAASTGCATHDRRERAFTGEWETKVKGDREFERRQKHIDESSLPLGIGSRGVVGKDEAGKPQASVGGGEGLGGRIRGRGAEVNYRYRWDFAKPPRRNPD